MMHCCAKLVIVPLLMPTEHLVHVYTYVLLHVNMSINDIVGVGVELCMPSFR